LQDRQSSTCYNINAKLAKFFKDPKAFRHVQARTGSLVGGKFGLAFFANAKIPDRLDIWPGDEMRGTKYQPPQELLTYLESDG
jgi:hypothetical protein